MNDYVVSFKRSRIVTFIFLSLVFIAIGAVFIAFTFLGNGFEIIWLPAIAFVVVILTGLCLVYYINVLLKGKPALTITEEGIIDNSSFIGAGLVRWEDIADIDFINFSNQVYLGIFTFDPDLITDRTTGFKRLLNNLNKGLLETQVNIPIKILEGSLDELVDEINNRWSVVIESNLENRERMTGPTKTLEDLK